MISGRLFRDFEKESLAARAVSVRPGSRSSGIGFTNSVAALTFVDYASLILLINALLLPPIVLCIFRYG